MMRKLMRLGVVPIFAALVAMLGAGAAMASTAAPSLPAHASQTMVIPQTATDCNPNPIQAANECTTVVGTGTYVDSISGQLFSNDLEELTALHIEIYGPNGTIHNCAAFNLAAGGVSEPCLWVNPAPHVHVTAGDYCTKAWQRIGSTYHVISTECVDVHV